MKKSIFSLLLISVLFISACYKDEETIVIHSGAGIYAIEYFTTNLNDDVSDLLITFTDPDVELLIVGFSYLLSLSFLKIQLINATDLNN